MWYSVIIFITFCSFLIISLWIELPCTRLDPCSMQFISLWASPCFWGKNFSPSQFFIFFLIIHLLFVYSLRFMTWVLFCTFLSPELNLLLFLSLFIISLSLFIISFYLLQGGRETRRSMGSRKSSGWRPWCCHACDHHSGPLADLSRAYCSRRRFKPVLPIRAPMVWITMHSLSRWTHVLKSLICPSWWFLMGVLTSPVDFQLWWSSSCRTQRYVSLNNGCVLFSLVLHFCSLPVFLSG